MKYPLAISLAALASVSVAGFAQEAAAPAGPPPGLKPFVMRAELDPARDRHAADQDGKALFTNKCGYCHLDGGMATNLLVGQMLESGRTPNEALLANRDDLTAEYVEYIVRNGKVAMPIISRVEVTDAELHAIAAYLGKGK